MAALFFCPLAEKRITGSTADGYENVVQTRQGLDIFLYFFTGLSGLIYAAACRQAQINGSSRDSISGEKGDAQQR